MAGTARGTFADADLIAVLRGGDADAICRASGATRAEFEEARTAFLRKRLPPENARLRAAVRGPVEILRDRSGMPHVWAGATEDLWFGVGFAMAQDRLWQMDRLRRRALGRQAEVMGLANVPSDLAHRLVGIPEIAAAEVGRTDERTRAILEALVAGVNRQIEECGRELPVEFALLGYEPEPFTVRDSIAILRGIWWSLNGRLETLVAAEAARVLPPELRRAWLTPERPEERIVPEVPARLRGRGAAEAAAGEGDWRGSNNWAVAAGRTATGSAILCSDPHQPFWLPASWYEYAVHGPEDDAAGAGHPGVPGFWWGSNGRIAWGVTNNVASTRDLYVEMVDPADPSRYREGDGWARFAEEPIEIAVAGEEPRRFTRRSTARGPIVNDILPAVTDGGDPPLSLRWVGQEHLDDVRAVVGIARARDWAGFRDALRDWAVAVFNFAYADREGNVGMQCAGRIPLRGRVKWGFRDALNPDDGWTGSVPFDDLPREEGPGRGYVGSANNKPAPDDYRYPLYGAWASGYRAARIDEALREAEAFDAERGRALQLDVRNLRAAVLCPAIVGRLAGAVDADARLLRDLLDGWDHEYRLDSPAPAAFETFMAEWQRRVAQERFPNRLVPLVRGAGGVAARLLSGDALGWFAPGTDLDALVAETAIAAVAALRERHGADPAGWRWGEVHLVHLRHPLSNPANADLFDLGPAPIAGGADTLCNTGVGPAPGCEAVGGVEYRIVVDFAEPDRFLAIQNAGNSGQPGSPHYGDQFAAWIGGGYRTVRLDRAGVEAESSGRTEIAPDGANDGAR